MARNTDDVRLESVQAHRKRLRQAFLLGGVEQRREIDDGVKSLVVSVVLAGVACAGCVGYSFVSHLLATSNTPSASVSAPASSASTHASASSASTPASRPTQSTQPTSTGTSHG